MTIPNSTLITVSSKGQVVIPKEFRAAAGLEAGTKVVVEYQSDGTIALHPFHYSIRELFGIGKKILNKSNLSDDDAIMNIIAEEDAQTQSGKH